MTITTLKDLWIVHRQQLHQKDNYDLTQEGTSIQYFSSGVEFKGQQAITKLSSQIPVSPLNFDAFQLSSLNVHVSESIDAPFTGSVAEEAILSWKAASTDLKTDEYQGARAAPLKRRLEGMHMSQFFDVFFNGWSPVDMNPQAFTKLHLLTVKLCS